VLIAALLLIVLGIVELLNQPVVAPAEGRTRSAATGPPSGPDAE
jgi:hypothetical protein